MHIALCIGAAVALASCSGAATNPAPAAAPEAPPVDYSLAPEGRLGPATTPTAYRLKLDLDSREAHFAGVVAIDIAVHEPVHTVWLHGKGLQIASARLEQGGQTFGLTAVTTERDSELLGLKAEATIARGQARLHLEWKGQLGTIQGLFRQTEDERWYIYSDFEATDARSAFPCYDDPRFKIPWDVSLQIPMEHLAFSNAPEVSRSVTDDGETLIRFASTRPLPSYLVAMAAGPFDLIEGKASQAPLRIIAPKGQAERGRFVLESTDKMLRYLETYLGVPMPFRKLDFIAVPRFGGAMENPGLITFSSGILLIGNSPSHAERRRALGVTAHELAHLWFGDLVTPDYWNDLWLNEAFATWLSDKAVAHAQPSRAAQVLDIADKTAAYAIDHGFGGRRVREPIANRDDIRAAFGRITYRKGGALLTMLEGWLGEERMRDGVRRYLQDGDGGTVVAETLISSMVNATGDKDIAPFFNSFLVKTGIPQVHVSVQCEGQPKITLRQSRYLPLRAGPQHGSQEGKQTWHLPICYRYPTDASGTTSVRQCIDFGSPSVSQPLKTTTCPAWLLPNDGDTGYYHYMLTAKDFAALPLDELSPRETLGLAHSISAAMHAGELNVPETLSLLEPLRNSQSPKVQEVISDLLYALANSVIGESERPAFAAMVRRWYRPLLAKVHSIPRADEAPWMTEVRPALMLLLADLGEDEELRRSSQSQAVAWLDNPHSMELALLDSLLQVAALGGDSALAGRYRDAVRGTKSRFHKLLLLNALHGFRDRELLPDLARRGERPMPAWSVLAGSLRYSDLRSIVLAELSAGTVEKKELALLVADLCDEDAIASVRALAKDQDAVLELLAPIRGCMAFARAQRGSASAHFAP
ncbi:MAG: M1 family metallopeptidase [Myxococcales bacterium]|nr:M1 family metallopeptidase [Myxococcales bacterium]